MKRFIATFGTVCTLLAFSSSAFAAKFSMRNANNQDIWVAVAAWMTYNGNNNSSTKVHAGFYKLVPGESRVFFDNDSYEINTAYTAIAYEENGVLQYKQPHGTGASAEYFDLSINKCQAYGNRYTCDVWVQVLGGIMAGGGRRLHFSADSGVITHLREGKTIRFVGQKTSGVLPNDIDR